MALFFVTAQAVGEADITSLHIASSSEEEAIESAKDALWAEYGPYTPGGAVFQGWDWIDARIA